MKIPTLSTALVAAALLLGATSQLAAQTAVQEHEAHHPPAGELAAGGAAPGPGMPGGMGGMMTPEMMRMMMQMMRGRGGGEDAPGMGMGRGMMGPGMGMGPGEGMGAGMMEDCPMMGMQRGGMGPRMGGMKGGAGGILGGPRHAPEEMTPERVRAWVEDRLEWIGNPRLALGDVETAADGSIIAEIVTADGSLVQTLAFNRYPGLFRVVTE